MARKLGWTLLIVALAAHAAAIDKPGSISGVVKDSAGVPQMGAAVSLFSPLLADAITVFTDDKGFYSVGPLRPGSYDLKTTAPAFLPSLRENVQIRPGAGVVLNITLNTLFEALQLPLPRKRSQQDDEDWKWTLRSTANRPILRVLDDGPVVVVRESEDGSEERVLKARVSFVAGAEAEGFGSAPDMTTAFNLEHSLFRSGTVSLDGRVGHSVGTPAVFRAAYRQQTPFGTRPEIALTARQFATPETAAHDAALQALGLTFTDQSTLGDLVELNYGAELQSIQFGKRFTAIRPFGALDLHLSPNWILQYRYSTSLPNDRLEKGFDTAPADLSESGPRLSLLGGVPALERARHQEIGLARRLGSTNVHLAVFSDRVSDAALTGVGDVTSESGEFLPDIYSGTFSYFGGDVNTSGMRVAVQRKIGSQTATVAYSYGGVLSMDGFDGTWQSVRPSLHVERRHALIGRVSGTVPAVRTRWIASYKWTSDDALTPVDMFNASPAQADPFFNLFIRQPIPQTSFLPGKMETLIEVRNLLAEGYVPVVGQDGQMLYLVQSARSIRGGLVFVF